MKRKNLSVSIIEIPRNVRIRYCEKKNQLVLIGVLKTITIYPDFKVYFKKSGNIMRFVYVTGFSSKYVSKAVNKKSKSLKGVYISKLYQIFVELTFTFYRNLKFVGVGYRAFNLNDSKQQLMFKLGYSHLIYCGLPKSMGSFCFKFTKIYLFGNVEFNFFNSHISKIRKLKVPEPYKGKGILYWEEAIKLKIGKRV